MIRKPPQPTRPRPPGPRQPVTFRFTDWASL